MSTKKKIAILGSTGSVGKQALEVIRNCQDTLKVVLLSANNQAELLVRQAIDFKPEAVIIRNEDQLPFVRKKLADLPIQVLGGSKHINRFSSITGFDLLLNALSGISGLWPTLDAIEHGKDIAMANKESMVAGGQLIMDAARQQKTSVIPVDSEHSAVFQCLQGESDQNIKKIFLTASGGPFKGIKHKDLSQVSVEQALQHPNWDMGKKITIDSATLANKGMEAIAAQWYFNLKPEQIDIILHPQSVVHALVQFHDGSIKAQMALPDMRLPIHYALNYPERKPVSIPHLDFSECVHLDFEKVNIENHPDLQLAMEAMQGGGNLPAALNAANETAAYAFLNKRIAFTQIAEVTKNVLQHTTLIPKPNLGEILATDQASRKIAEAHIKTIPGLNR